MHSTHTFIFVMAGFFLIGSDRLDAQSFQHIFGDSKENFFTQVLQEGSHYFVLGQDFPTPGGQPHATITQLNLTGHHIATVGLSFPSVWNDAVVVSTGGGLMVVGSTLPLNGSSTSLIARITTSPLQIQWLHQYDGAGRDAFHRVVENTILPNPDPYYVVGYETETPGFNIMEEDVVLLNFSSSGTLNWKNIYRQNGDDEFMRDFEVDGTGVMYLCGNTDLIDGILYALDQTGTITGAAQITGRSFQDLAVGSGGIYTVSSDYITKFDFGLQLQWDFLANSVNSLHQIWEGVPGQLYLTGNHNQGDVIMKILDAGPTLDWVKYPSVGTNASNGSAWLLSGPKMGYLDGRIVSNVGFGAEDAFLSVSDLDGDGCMVATASATISQTNANSSFVGLPAVQSVFPIPIPTVLIGSASLNWDEEVACDSCVCSYDQILSGITLLHMGLAESLYCLPHGVQTPTIQCPTGDIEIFGFFGCESFFSGDLCAETQVNYVLTDQQANVLDMGTTTNFSSLTFPQSFFINAGTYFLTLSTLCPGAADSCVCTMDWIVECDSCCLDFDLFCQAVEDSTTIVLDPSLCKVTLNIGQLPDCDSIAYVNWGDGWISNGNFGSGSMPMHTYFGSGTYYISYLAYEIDPQTGFYCFEKLLMDTITIVCDSIVDTCHTTCPTRQWNPISADYFIHDITVFQGKLIVGGSFSVNNANNIAAWDGSNWTTIGTSGVNGVVRALTVYNGELYVGGSFTLADNTPVNGIAKWNGNIWADVGGGVTGGVLSLQVYGPNLVAGGSFTMAGVNPASNIALWNGSNWSPMSSGMNGSVHGLGLFNGNLVAGGVFSSPANNIAIWNGSSWNNLGGGINMITGNVFQGAKAILQFGQNLIVGGRFDNAGNMSDTRHIALWNGLTWGSLGTGGVNISFEGLYDLVEYDGDLYAGGFFTQIGGNPISGVARWNGTVWSDVQHQNQLVWALAEYQNTSAGATCDLYSGGEVFLNIWDCVTGIQDPIENELGLFPNPNDGQFTLDLSSLTSENVLIRIHDLNGKVVAEHRVPAHASAYNVQAANFSRGMYYLQVLASGRIQARSRFVIQ